MKKDYYTFNHFFQAKVKGYTAEHQKYCAEVAYKNIKAENYDKDDYKNFSKNCKKVNTVYHQELAKKLGNN